MSKSFIKTVDSLTASVILVPRQRTRNTDMARNFSKRYVVVTETLPVVGKTTYSYTQRDTRRDALVTLDNINKRIRGTIGKRAYIVDRVLQPHVILN
jgi:hypothetical protein